MRVPDGRRFTRDGIGDQFRAGRKADDVLSRRLNRQPKIPEAASGGGISGVTRCDAVDYATVAAGTTTVLKGVEWQFSSLDGSTGPSVSTGADANAVYVAAEGWYMATLNYNVAWSAVPGNLAANITFTGDNVDYPTDFKPIYTVMGSTFAQSRMSFSTRWILVPAGGFFRASLGWTTGPSVGSFHHFALDITQG